MIREKECFEKMRQFESVILGKVKKAMLREVKTGLDIPHMQVLLFIRKQGSCKVTEIAKYCHITLSAVTNLANKLVDMRLITRNRSEKDRRIVLIELAEEGKKQIDIIEKNKKILSDEMFSCLSDSEIESFYSIIDKILLNFAKKDHEESNQLISVG